MSAAELVDIAPEKPNHKESLAIYKLFTNYPTLKITRLLNNKYSSRLHHGQKFYEGLVDRKLSEGLVERKWEEMVETKDDIYVMVQKWKDDGMEDYWRVTRVIKWAEKNNVKNPV